LFQQNNEGGSFNEVSCLIVLTENFEIQIELLF